MPALICSTADACSSDAAYIFPTSSLEVADISETLPISSTVSATTALPLATDSIVSVMITAVLFVASSDFVARFLTSSATTAKPLPASPALAASTAALSARILVWNAISSIALIILLI